MRIGGRKAGDRALEADAAQLLRSLRLPTMAAELEETARRAEANDWSPKAFLGQLLRAEIEARTIRRVARFLKASDLPAGKTAEALDLKRYPLKTRRRLKSLMSGDFLDRAENVLIFGKPGRGKSHMAAALGHELVQRGRRVLFIPTFQLVQQLLVAKRDLMLEKLLGRLDRFELVILDDIGYVQQERDEIEVLFTFLGERYERRSVMVTSNLVFSQWNRIFKDPMTTACAIERVVHHSTIIELTGTSYRAEAAARRNKEANVEMTAINDGEEADQVEEPVEEVDRKT